MEALDIRPSFLGPLGPRRSQESRLCGSFCERRLNRSRAMNRAIVRRVTSSEEICSCCVLDLANERTFLAWVRTGLGSAGLGVLLAKGVGTDAFFAVGLVLICQGILVMAYGFYR